MPEVILSSIVAGGLFVVALSLFFRHRNQQLEHQERMAAIEKGAPLPPRQAPAQWSPRVYLLRGLIWTFTGAALTIALFGAAVSDHRRYRESSEILSYRAKTVSQNLQIPIEQARQIVEKDEAAREEHETGAPPAIALFGLIPLGVGIAYLVYYKAEASNRVAA